MPRLPAVSLRLPLILLAFAAALVFIPFIQALTSRLASAAVTVSAQSDATLSALTVSVGAKDLTLDPVLVPGTLHPRRRYRRAQPDGHHEHRPSTVHAAV